MPGIVDTMKKKIDEVDKSINPFRRAADAMTAATTPKAMSPEEEARARGESARNQAVARGMGATVKVDDSIKKRPF
jgi:hypothetical protein